MKKNSLISALVLGTYLNFFSGCRTLNFSLTNPDVPEVDSCFDKALAIRPIEDPEDYWQTPQQTEETGEGDCEDKSLLLQSCLWREKKIVTRIVCGYPDKFALDEKKGHAWVEYRKNGITYILDAGLRMPVHKKVTSTYIPSERGCNSKKLNDYHKRAGYLSPLFLDDF
jgi:hypothetical protein